MSVTTVKCSECEEWFDARYSECPNGHHRPEYNHALKKANDMTRLNGALASQMRAVQPEVSATRMVPTGSRGAAPYSKLPGSDLVAQDILRKMRQGDL